VWIGCERASHLYTLHFSDSIKFSDIYLWTTFWIHFCGATQPFTRNTTNARNRHSRRTLVRKMSFGYLQTQNKLMDTYLSYIHIDTDWKKKMSEETYSSNVGRQNAIFLDCTSVLAQVRCNKPESTFCYYFRSLIILYIMIKYYKKLLMLIVII